MTRHSFDPLIFDYTWKQNRLSKDKEALKNSMLNVIRKKPKAATGAAPARGAAAADTAGDQGYGATATKKDAVGAQGMVVDQAAQQSHPANRASAAAASKQIANRGSEFKNNAQQMLNKWTNDRVGEWWKRYGVLRKLLCVKSKIPELKRPFAPCD